MAGRCGRRRRDGGDYRGNDGGSRGGRQNNHQRGGQEQAEQIGRAVLAAGYGRFVVMQVIDTDGVAGDEPDLECRQYPQKEAGATDGE